MVDKSTSSQITLSNLIVENNSSGSNGGGISIVSANVNINNVISRNNSANNGGGFHVSVVNGEDSTSGANKIINISHSLINNNTSVNAGGAFYVYAGGIAVNKTLTINMENTTMALNSSEASGGIGYAQGGQLADGSGLPTLTLNMTHVTCGRNTATGNAINFGLYFNRTHGSAANNLNFNAYNSIFVAAGTITARGINFAYAQSPNFINNVSSDLQNTQNIANNVNNITGLTAGQIGLPTALTDEGGFSNVLALTATGDAVDHCTSATGTTLPMLDQRGYTRDASADAGAFELGKTLWTGTTSIDWATATNWSTGVVPTSSDFVSIDGTFTNEPSIISTDAAVSPLFVATGNTLTIDETSSLTVSGDFTNSGGTVTLNSTADDFSSLIVAGTATGDITYNRYVNAYNDGFGGGWDLVGSPTVMTIEDFITANGANIQVLGNDYAFSQYDNTIDDWLRYETASQTGSFNSGQGYSMATVSDGPPPPGAAGTTVAFTGTMQTADQSINVINNNGLNGVGRRWNLVSNPFPSYINGNTAAEAVNNFMDVNSGVIDGSFLGVYGWNGSSYTTYNFTSDAFSIAPGQGFWIAALNTADTALDFTTAMRTTTGTGDFVAGPQPLVYKLELKLFNGDTEKAATKFYFRDGLSLDLDPGYDAGAYNQSTKLSTRLPQGSQEFAFEINAMGIDALQNTRVPLEIRQNAGQEFRVSIADMELPQDIYVYLEDTLNGTLTSLKEQDFELVAQSNLSGVDRFFIVFKSNSVLSNGDAFGIEALNVYKANTDSFVTIAGITPELGQLNVSLYNILGQTVREKALNPTTATQSISTQGLASGLYIIQLKSGNQVFTKKIVVH